MNALPDMDIITNDEEVLESRKIALELLLSEHVGDCEAPCRITCPANMDIPLMNRLLAAGDFQGALRIVKNDIALPSTLGRICPAPCEGACRRKPIDGSVSICLLKRFAGDTDLSSNLQYLPEIPPETGFKIAIIGAGPAGLSAAYYLRIRGHHCDIYEKSSHPGGALRTAISEDILPPDILKREIEIIQKTGVRIFCDHNVDRQLFEKLGVQYHALIIACKFDEQFISDSGFEFSGTGIIVNKTTFQTSKKNVFAIGSALRSSRLAVRSLGQGKETAFSVDQYLNNMPLTGEPKMFNSRFGKLFEEEYSEYLKESVPFGRLEPEDSSFYGFSAEEVMKEAARCLRCDCRAKDDCLLRIYSDKYHAEQKRFSSEQRKSLKKYDQHDFVIYEPAKCIKCGKCVRITSLKKEMYGLTYIGRGFNVEIGAPFNEELKNALTVTAKEVISACPTGALSSKTNE